MNFLLQSNELAQDVWFVAGAAVVLLVLFLYYRKVKKDQAERVAELHDPRSHVVNDGSYNIDHSGIDDHRLKSDTPRETEELVDNFRETDQLPSAEEFHELRDNA